MDAYGFIKNHLLFFDFISNNFSLKNWLKESMLFYEFIGDRSFKS